MESSTMTPRHGIEPSRIRNFQHLDDILQQVTCSICQLILRKPISCSTCKSSFCHSCITEWLQSSANKKSACPCRCEFTRNQASLVTQDILSQLQISCAYSASGCLETPSYEELESHESTCSYQKTVCKGCNKTLLLRDLKEHENACKDFKIICVTCKQNFSSKGYQAHERMECLQREFVKFRTSVEKHMNSKDDQISNLIKENTELKRKVDTMKNEMGGKISSLLNNMQQSQTGTMLCEKNKDYRHNFIYDRKEPEEANVMRSGKANAAGISCGSCNKVIKTSESYLKCRNCGVTFCKKCVYEFGK